MYGRTQQTFDFGRAAKIKIIERTQLLMLPLRSQLRAKTLLRVIESHSRDHASCWLSVETIRLEMGCSESTVHRAITDCEAAGILAVERHPHASSTFTLKWSLLIDLSRESIDDLTWSQIRAGFDAVKNARGVRCADQGCQMRREMTPLSAPESLQRIPPPKKPEKQTQQQNKSTAFDFEWAAVVAELDKENILAGGQSVIAASAAGVSAEFVMHLIDHYRSRCLNGVRAFGPGALMRRIEKARLGQSADALWPAPCAAYQREVEREKSRKPAKAETIPEPVPEFSDEQRQAVAEKMRECIGRLRKQVGVIA